VIGCQMTPVIVGPSVASSVSFRGDLVGVGHQQQDAREESGRQAHFWRQQSFIRGRTMHASRKHTTQESD